MKYIILCGGIGKQTARHPSLPKPLNFIQGRHMIEYVVDNIPSNEVFIIYNIFSTITLVFPEPGPAETIKKPSVQLTASF